MVAGERHVPARVTSHRLRLQDLYEQGAQLPRRGSIPDQISARHEVTGRAQAQHHQETRLPGVPRGPGHPAVDVRSASKRIVFSRVPVVKAQVNAGQAGLLQAPRDVGGEPYPGGLEPDIHAAFG